MVHCYFCHDRQLFSIQLEAILCRPFSAFIRIPLASPGVLLLKTWVFEMYNQTKLKILTQISVVELPTLWGAPLLYPFSAHSSYHSPSNPLFCPFLLNIPPSLSLWIYFKMDINNYELLNFIDKVFRFPVTSPVFLLPDLLESHNVN